MNKTLVTLLAATAATCITMGAQAQEAAATAPAATTASAPLLNKTEAKDLKNHSNADYKARKKIADARLIENKANCETAADGSVERACNSDMKAQAKKEKADAKVIHEVQKDSIKTDSK